MRVRAEVLDGVSSETAHGGLTMNWETLGPVWLKLGPRRRRERAEAGGARQLETLTAEAWTDGRLKVGRLLRFEGSDWRIASGETVGGRAVLLLERST